MRFKLLSKKDRHDIGFGTVTEENVYIRTYATYSGKRPTELDVDEMCPCKISLSGETGHYYVVRVD